MSNNYKKLIYIPFRFVDAQKIKRVTADLTIPSMEDLNKIEKNDVVKISNGKEQFLVAVKNIDDDNLEGRVENLLLENKDYDKGDFIRFRKNNVLQVAPKLTFKDMLAKFSDTEIIDVKKFPTLVNYFPYNKQSYKLLANKEAIYSTSNPKIMREVIGIIENELNIPAKTLIITDATANIGGSAINFAKYCQSVNAIELNPDTFKLLENNVKLYNLDNIKLYNDDYLKVMHNFTQDVVFIDPPWGGLDYKSKTNLMLYLSNIPVWQIILDLKDSAQLVALKLPHNFDIAEFEKKLSGKKIINHTLDKFLLTIVYV